MPWYKENRNMSVPVRNRSLSAIEFIHNFNKLRNYATDMLMSAVVIKESEWLVNCWRGEMRYILRKLGTAIEVANSVYVETRDDLNDKIKYLNISIGLCNALKDLLQEIIYRTGKIDGNMKVLGDMIKKEINLLKGVRRKKYQVSINRTASVESVSNSTNFCNCNNNGNANNNNASYADNFVRPDFGSK